MSNVTEDKLEALSPAQLKKVMMSPGQSSYGNESFEDDFDVDDEEAGVEGDAQNRNNKGEEGNDDDIFGDEGDEDDNGLGGEGGKTEDVPFEEGMNLDDFLKQFGQDEGEEGEPSDGNAEGRKSTKNEVIDPDHPAMRPLDGMSPPVTGKDARDLYLSKALMGSKNSTPGNFSVMLSPGRKQDGGDEGDVDASGGGSNHKTPSPGKGSQNSSMSGSEGKNPGGFSKKLHYAISEEEKNASKVNDLLNQLRMKRQAEENGVSVGASITGAAAIDNKAPPYKYPVLVDSAANVANNYKKLKHKLSNALSDMNIQDGVTEAEVRAQQQGHGHGHHGSLGVGAGASVAGQGGGREVNMLSAQVAQLKADLKRRDDRLGRLMEHDSLLGNKCDALTKEVAQLKQQLQAAQAEVKTQASRAQDAVLTKKKKKKMQSRIDELEKENNKLCAENASCTEREGALMEAIDELSRQNEDLMRQLKAAMDKEVRFTHIISSISAARDHGENGSKENSPSQHGGGGMVKSKSGFVASSGGNSGEKPSKQPIQTRRKRSKTTDLPTATYGGGAAATGKAPTGPQGKLPNLYRHNHMKNFHCYD